MAKFSVDVKAFIRVEVEAENADEARTIADNFVEHLSPECGYIGGYNEGLAVAGETAKIGSTNGFDVDGESDVEELCLECGYELDEFTPGEFPNKLCAGCQPDEPEVPYDTPSLDTSFHDHEMDVG